MAKRPDKLRQTLDHRSPECLWHGKTPDQAIDMWSVAVVVAYMCGHSFCNVGEGEVNRLIRQWVEQLGAPRADLLTGYPAWEKDKRLLLNSPTAARPWPPAMAIVLGRSGQELLSSLFSYTPHERPNSSEVLEHPFMAVGSFPLMGVKPAATEHDQGSRPGLVLDNSEGLGRVDDPHRKPFYPVTPGVEGQTLLAGERHKYGFRCKEVARETLLHILGDDVFLEGTVANRTLVDLCHGREVVPSGEKPLLRCVIKGPKTRIGGHMGTCPGVSMIGICTKRPCLVARVIDFRAAFLKANEPWLLAMQSKCKSAVSRLGRKRRGKNGDHFLKATLEEWFLPSCEVTLTEDRDCRGLYLEERHHMDGSMSLFHGGLTLGGNRDLFLNVEGFGRVRVPNSPGTFYLGNLTGPRHQVIHQRCVDHDYVDVPGLGRRSMTIMFRTGLFPHERSRFMEQLPKPKALWSCLKNHMVEALQKPGLRLPTVEEVKKQTQLREELEKVNQHSKLRPRGGARPAPSSKRRRIHGKTNKEFVEE